MAPMKILMTADTVGGVFTYAVELLHAMRTHGHHTALVTMGPLPSKDQLERITACGTSLHHHINGRLEWMQDPWSDLEVCGRELQLIARKFRPDLIHFNHFAHVAMEWDCPVLLVAHSCVISWHAAVVGGTLPPHLTRYHELVRRNLQAADAVVAPSHSMLQEFERLHGPFRQGVAIHNGIARTPPSSAPRERVVFSMGRLWDPAKNIATLIAAAPFIDAEIRIAGDGAPTDLPPNVTWLGRLGHADVLQQLDKARVYALPVRYEPFGLSFLEAAQRGCALVGGDIPTLREIWDDALVGIPPNDAKALARACNTLLNDVAAAERMAALARERTSVYTSERQYTAYHTLDRTLLRSYAARNISSHA
jgi:glycogen synthase